jgi:AhpC/TSA antioxidant enzyme
VKVLEMRERVDAAGTAVVVVHDRAERLARGLLRDLDVPYPVVIDLERRAYRDWGLRRASIPSTYLAPRIWLGYAQRMLRGEPLRPPGRDTLQLGGDFVVDAGGTVVYSHPQRAADDRPPVGVLVRELEAAARP